MAVLFWTVCAAPAETTTDKAVQGLQYAEPELIVQDDTQQGITYVDFAVLVPDKS